MTTNKATTTKVLLANNVEVDGLMMPNGDFALASTQIADLFSVPQKHSSRDLKAALGKDSAYPKKQKTAINSKAVWVYTTEEVYLIGLTLGFKGNELAQDFCKSHGELGLKQLFCDAFGVKFEQDERQEWIKTRANGKKARRSFTDAVKDYDENGGEVNYGLLTLNIYDVTFLRNKYDAWKLVFDTPKARNANPFRNTLSDDELLTILVTEENATAAMENKGMSPNEAILDVAYLVRR